jgi:hypothetical protein
MCVSMLVGGGAGKQASERYIIIIVGIPKHPLSFLVTAATRIALSSKQTPNTPPASSRPRASTPAWWPTPAARSGSSLRLVVAAAVVLPAGRRAGATTAARGAERRGRCGGACDHGMPFVLADSDADRHHDDTVHAVRQSLAAAPPQINPTHPPTHLPTIMAAAVAPSRSVTALLRLPLWLLLGAAAAAAAAALFMLLLVCFLVVLLMLIFWGSGESRPAGLLARGAELVLALPVCADHDQGWVGAKPSQSAAKVAWVFGK